MGKTSLDAALVVRFGLGPVLWSADIKLSQLRMQDRFVPRRWPPVFVGGEGGIVFKLVTPLSMTREGSVIIMTETSFFYFPFPFSSVLASSRLALWWNWALLHKIFHQLQQITTGSDEERAARRGRGSRTRFGPWDPLFIWRAAHSSFSGFIQT